MRFPKFAPALIIALLLSGCDKGPKPDTPEGALQKYVEAAFSAKSVSDKQKLADLSTGEALAYLEKMNDDDFRRQFLESSLSLVSIKMKDKHTEGSGDVSLVYEIEFRSKKDNKTTVMANKKIAYLMQADGNWKIKSTKNMKTFIEQKEDLVITPEPPPQEQKSGK